MKTIGMLGGMSWESTSEYYRLANQLVRQRLGGVHSAKIVMTSVDYGELAPLLAAGQWDEAGQMLSGHARALEQAGADFLLICANTMHQVYEQVQAAVQIPALHLVEVIAEAIRAQGLERVGLLGTAYTMELDFYRDRLASHGITTLVPDATQRARVHEVIYAELVRGVLNEQSRQDYREIMVDLVSRGAEGVILGCTEIELLVRPEDCEVPTFASTALHVQAAVELAFTPR